MAASKSNRSAPCSWDCRAMSSRDRWEQKRYALCSEEVFLWGVCVSFDAMIALFASDSMLLSRKYFTLSFSNDFKILKSNGCRRAKGKCFECIVLFRRGKHIVRKRNFCCQKYEKQCMASFILLIMLSETQCSRFVFQCAWVSAPSFSICATSRWAERKKSQHGVWSEEEVSKRNRIQRMDFCIVVDIWYQSAMHGWVEHIPQVVPCLLSNDVLQLFRHNLAREIIFWNFLELRLHL